MELPELFRFQLLCFEKFLEGTRAFIDRSQKEQHVPDTGRLLHRRACTLKTLEALDQHIEKTLETDGLPQHYRELSQVYLEKRSKLLAEIHCANNELFQIIENELTTIQNDLKKDHDAREKLGRFKSHPENSGRGFDRRY